MSSLSISSGTMLRIHEFLLIGVLILLNIVGMQIKGPQKISQQFLRQLEITSETAVEEHDVAVFEAFSQCSVGDLTYVIHRSTASLQYDAVVEYVRGFKLSQSVSSRILAFILLAGKNGLDKYDSFQEFSEDQDRNYGFDIGQLNVCVKFTPSSRLVDDDVELTVVATLLSGKVDARCIAPTWKTDFLRDSGTIEASLALRAMNMGYLLDFDQEPLRRFSFDLHKLWVLLMICIFLCSFI